MNKIQIQNGKVYSEQGFFEERPLYVLGERLVEEAEYRAAKGEETLLDAAGGYVIPGLTDLHFHGCVGHDCCDGTVEAFGEIAKYEARHGITTITPATMTVSKEQLLQVAGAAAEYAEKPIKDGAVLAGLYMEGPFISAKKKGAQNELHIRKPDVELFRRLQQEAKGLFRSVVLAPETEGAQEFICSLAGEVNISLGHMMADYETARLAFENGARQMTHLYNAMPGLSHRDPGPVGAAADAAHCRVELICDGVHIHPSVVRATFRIFGQERVIMISDSLRAAGMPDGEYELGGQQFFVKGKLATLSDGTIAGSASNLMDCLRTVVKKMGIPLTAAVRAAAVNPAKAVGIYGEYGSLEPGKYANLVVMKEDLALQEVLVQGRRIPEVL